MKLLVKFNLIYIVVIALGVAVCGYISRNLLEANARQDVLDQARMLIEKALAVRAYTSGQVTQLLETQMKYEFLPQSVPSYSANEVMGTMLKKYPEFFYKEATLNPTNPRDRAAGWEVDVVNQFRNAESLKEVVGERSTTSGRSLFVARPLRITNGACLRCHSSVEAAPRTMVERYGPANGFGWNMNEVVGAQIVSVPMDVPLQRAQSSFGLFIGSMIAVFVVVGVVLNMLIWWFVVRPVTRLSQLADRVSQGDLHAPAFDVRSRDEIGQLAQSFTRMRASIVHAMKLLDS
jgi:protein-histidine pros-kinase